MAYFAKIDPSTNVVEKVFLIEDSEATTESEGKSRCVELFGATAEEYIQTTKATDFRGPFAMVGGTWDSVNKVFIPLCSYKGWIWNNSNLKWEPPSDPPVPFLEDLPVGVTTTMHPRWIDDTETWIIETII